MVIRPLESLLLQLIVYLLLWLSNEYLATLLSLIFGSICLAILLIALIAEGLERSRIGRRYFWHMAAAVAAPALAAVLYLSIFGELSWLREG